LIENPTLLIYVINCKIIVKIKFQIMKKIFSFFVMLMLFSIFAASLMAQTPQYYNYNTGGTSNGFPLNQPPGKMAQTLHLPGEFSNPTPAPSGQITSVFVQLSTAMTNKPFTDLTIKMGQTTLTDLTAGTFYSGTMTTVYYRPSIIINNPAGWLEFILDTPFPYNPTQSIVIEIGQCQSAMNTGGSILYTITSGIKRVWSTGGCPFTPWATSNAYITHTGIKIGSVGIEEKEPLKVEIYPVPNDGQFNISLGGGYACALSLEVYNSLGLMIFSKMVSGQQNSQVIPVDLKPVPPGIYSIIIRSSGEQTLHKKIVVTK
jgi:hypothetical protein